MTLPFPDFSFELGTMVPHELSREKSNDWINLHDGIEKLAANFVIENVIHVSMERFMRKMESIVLELFSISKTKKLLLYVPTKKKDTSNYFVSSLLYRRLRFEKISDDLTEFYEFDKDEYLIVTCDDAAFTGKQLSIYLSTFLHFTKVSLFLAIGFVSETAKKKLSGEFPRLSFAHDVEIFDTLKNTIKKSKIFRNLCSVEKSEILRVIPPQHALYFDFKLPDEVSIIHDILACGRVLSKQKKNMRSFPLISNGVPVPFYKNR